MRDPKRRAISAAVHWLRKCASYGVTADEIVALSTANQEAVNHEAVNRKENEKGKENFPPDPYIEKREEQEKDNNNNNRAREREGATVDIPDDPNERREKVANYIPTLEQALEWAKTRLAKHQCTPEVVKEWYDYCTDSFWCDKNGNPIHNWGQWLALYARYHEKRVRNDAKSPSRRMVVRNSFHADNWRPTDPSKIQMVF